MLQQHDRRQLVRLTARTAAPIVSAVPKCAKPTAPRTHPLDTVHGIAASGYLQGPAEAHQHHQQQRRHHHHQHNNHNPPNYQPRHLLAPADQQHQEQVLLIVQDEHSKVPVIGRRLPTKSMPPSNYGQELYLRHGASSNQRDQEPVVGRRSHRLQNHHQQHQQQQQQQQQHQQQHHYRQLYTEDITEDKQVVRRHHQLFVVQQQTNYSPQPSGGYLTGSQYCTSLNDYPMKPSLVPNHQGGLMRPAKLHRHHPSSSCSSLCSVASTTTTDDLCPSCSPSASVVTTAACCRLYGSPMGRVGRSSSCQRLEPLACSMVPNGGHLKKPTKEEALQVMVPVDYHDQPQRSHARNLLSHHHMCQANETPKKSAYQRASSCHDERARNQQQQPLLISDRNLLPVCPKPALMAQQQHSKTPKSRHHQCSTDKSSALKEPQVEPQVSQMYESLAAELKAKLGDPRLGPILLPPKDYDTMSRRQGKLSGIELRRSTNPQLVGPAAVPGTTTTNKEPRQDEYVNSNKQRSSGVSGSDSARSSGRSQSDDKSLGSRSRSNSSSGLGSISMNLGSSSTSSPSSQSTSSEDMLCHQQHHDDVVSAVATNRFVGTTMAAIVGSVDEKQLAPRSPSRVNSIEIGSSPDNGTSSDSGHSESCGQFESADGTQHQHSRDADAHDNNEHVTKPNATSSAKPSSLASPDQFEAKPKANSDQQQLRRNQGIQHHHPSKASSGVLWNGRVEVPLKVNNDKNGHTYLATKQIIY